MDLLIAMLMMLGVYCTPDKLNDKNFLDANSAAVKQAQEMIDSGAAAEELNKGGIVVTDDGSMKH